MCRSGQRAVPLSVAASCCCPSEDTPCALPGMMRWVVHAMGAGGYRMRGTHRSPQPPASRVGLWGPPTSACMRFRHLVSPVVGRFALGHLVRPTGPWLPLTDEPVPEPRWHRSAIPEAQGLQLLQAVPVPWHRQALRRPHAFDAIEHAWPVTYGRQPFPVELPAIFVVDAGYVDHTPHLAFASRMAQPHREPMVNREPIGLRAPIVALHLMARGLDHDSCPALGHQGAVSQTPSRPASEPLTTRAASGTPKRGVARTMSSHTAAISRAGTRRSRGRCAGPVVQANSPVLMPSSNASNHVGCAALW